MPGSDLTLNTMNITRVHGLELGVDLNLTLTPNASATHFDKITTNTVGFQFAALAVTIGIAIFR